MDAAGNRRRRPLPDCATARFEDVVPVRPFRWSPGSRHFPGWYWSTTTGQHVGFESWLERDHLALMEFDPAAMRIASQPFWPHWHDGSRERRHAPDFFVRRADGSAVVVDVRPDDWIAPRDAESFEVTRLARKAAGWGIAGGSAGGSATGERAVAVALPSPPLPTGSGRCPADGGLLAAGTAGARGRCGWRPSRGAARVVPPVVEAGIVRPRGWRSICWGRARSCAWLVGCRMREEGRRVPPTARIAEFPNRAAHQARWWESHILEVLHGLPPDAPQGTLTSPSPACGPRSIASQTSKA